jgi:hypothetical protein
LEWCRLYANLRDDERVQAAEDTAQSGWLLVLSMCYCTAAENGGFIPHSQVRRFGLANAERKVKGLLAENLWRPADGGYLLDPDLWSEERHLSDSADRKRRADRDRQAAKRARDKAASNGSGHSDTSRDESRDNRVTVTPANGDGHSDASRDSRGHRRGEKRRTPPTPPGDVRPLWPSAVADVPEEGEESQDTDTPLNALVTEVRKIRPEWSSASIRRALAHRDVTERGWKRARPAMLAVAADPASEQPGRLRHDGPWWKSPGPIPAAPRPADRDPWCGQCDEKTRLTRDDQPRRCEVCHPLREAS